MRFPWSVSIVRSLPALRLLSADATHVEGRDVHVSVCSPSDSRHPGPYLRVPRNALVASALRRSRGPRPEYKPTHQRPGPTQQQRLLAANVLHKAVVHLELAAFQRRFGLTPWSRQEGGRVAGMHKQAGGSRTVKSLAPRGPWVMEDPSFGEGFGAVENQACPPVDLHARSAQRSK